MRRRLFTLMAALSLMACIAIAAASVSSYWGDEGLALDRYCVPEHWEGLSIIGYKPGDVGWDLRREVTAYRGTIGLHQLRLCPGMYVVEGAPRPTGWHLDAYRENDPYDPTPTGFHWSFIPAHCVGSSAHWEDGEFRAVCPAWCLMLIAGMLPAVRIGHWMRANRRSKFSLCKTCGYDLRATPDRCPECGTFAGGTMPRA